MNCMYFKFLFHKDDPDHICGPSCNHNHSDNSPEFEVISSDTKQKIIPSKSRQDLSFENFINFFPVVELPYTITSETHRILSANNDPIAAKWMFEHVYPQKESIDEFTEFMPCFAIPGTNKFFGLIFWEANLEGNSFYLSTFSLKGILINQQKIAGMKYVENGILQMVCTISPNWLFSCVEAKVDQDGYPVSISEDNQHIHSSYQISGDGEIVAV